MVNELPHGVIQPNPGAKFFWRSRRSCAIDDIIDNMEVVEVGKGWMPYEHLEKIDYQ